MNRLLPLSLPFLCLLAFVACKENTSSAGPGVSPHTVPSASRATVSFYHIPKCFLCGEISGVLRELEKQYDSQLNFRTVDYHLPASQEIIQRFQLGTHGIVVTDAEGTEIWKLIAHKHDRASLNGAIEKIAKGELPAANG